LKGFRFLRRRLGLDEERPRSETPLDELAQNIQYYVHNTISLFDELEAIALEREDDKHMRVVDPKNTFVLVAGQASQFPPLQHAIQNYCARRGLMTQFLKHDEAKEACCKGAVSYHLSNYLFENPNEFFGIYGFFSEVETDRIKLIPSAALKTGEPVKVRVDSAAMHTLIYLPHPANPEDIMTKHRASVAPIDRFTPQYEEESGESRYFFEVTYNQEGGDLKVNDRLVNEVGSFGLLTKDIYEKVWPDILRPLTMAPQ